MTTFDTADVEASIVYDKPASGMWHCGPNSGWLTLTHRPSRTQVRVYCRVMHSDRAEAMAALEMLVAMSRGDLPWFPENVE